ncbi:hypothetical protein [Liquorilactobacillus hordei]|uniref:Uncharacterized protein n=1 Tax=Liquorilactobacillus hordei DSM 19519 TaxID=1423759 RepID=A0A0R1MJ24_9LACO|nr:hypothetical protein [Liquorilactobacillus hordei]KRL07991.1 hypothetical protein FC92_GL001062 [Liquorilactobacillus hordei DSM 19519]QYH51065.1 hypothetical protein G6O70_00435 [Liquorilactobacillus hordei DSM 19519]
MDDLDILIEQFNELGEKSNDYFFIANRNGNSVQFRDSLSLLMTISYTGLEMYDQIAFIDREEFELMNKMIIAAKRIND